MARPKKVVKAPKVEKEAAWSPTFTKPKPKVEDVTVVAHSFRKGSEIVGDGAAVKPRAN